MYKYADLCKIYVSIPSRFFPSPELKKQAGIEVTGDRLG